MNYANYEDSIMQSRKCKIVGYPSDVPFVYPSLLTSIPKMRILHDGWMDSSICWVWMTTAEVKEHAEELLKRRDAGEIIGKKRKTRVTKKKQDNKEGSTDEGDEENSQPSKKAKKTKGTTKVRGPKTTVKKVTAVKAQMPPRSALVVIDSSDEDR